jgi:hypothetical protein
VRSLNSLSAIDLRKHREIKNETEETNDTKTEPFEILKRIENEGAAILKSSTSVPSTAAREKLLRNHQHENLQPN